MLLSMTGFGRARRQDTSWDVSVEIRTVNSRFLKVSLKCPEALATLESVVDRVVRESLARGTVNIALRVEGAVADAAYQVHRKVAGQYWTQCLALAEELKAAMPADVSKLLELPGVVTEIESDSSEFQPSWPLIEGTLKEALDKLQGFRIAEGRSMETELRNNCQSVATEVERISGMAQHVAVNYRDRLLQRLQEMLVGSAVNLDQSDLIRELSIYAERADINEELIRLGAHLEQFGVFLDESTSQGRKLEFLCQEMFREVNTIGAKANDVGIAHAVVEMKAAIEKMREILQNVE